MFLFLSSEQFCESGNGCHLSVCVYTCILYILCIQNYMEFYVIYRDSYTHTGMNIFANRDVYYFFWK